MLLNNVSISELKKKQQLNVNGAPLIVKLHIKFKSEKSTLTLLTFQSANTTHFVSEDTTHYSSQ